MSCRFRYRGKRKYRTISHRRLDELEPPCVFRAADVPEGVTKQERHAAVEAPPSGTVTAAGVGVVVAVPLSVDFFLILNVDP